MSASQVLTPSTGNPILDAIDGGGRWSGAISYNRVDPLSPAETGAFSEALPALYQTAGAGLTNAMWELVDRSLTVLQP